MAGRLGMFASLPFLDFFSVLAFLDLGSDDLFLSIHQHKLQEFLQIIYLEWDHKIVESTPAM